MNSKLDTIIENRDLNGFFEYWKKQQNRLSIDKKQLLITILVDKFYSDTDYDFFKVIFDIILNDKISLDFRINHFAPSLLSLTAHIPSLRLFDYFISKGANVNFIVDQLGSSNETNSNIPDIKRYWTCLDFAEIMYDDLHSIDYNYPELKYYYNADWRRMTDEEGLQLISKREFYSLAEQAKYLKDIIILTKLIDRIKEQGGKTYKILRRKHKK